MCYGGQSKIVKLQFSKKITLHDFPLTPNAVKSCLMPVVRLVCTCVTRVM